MDVNPYRGQAGTGRFVLEIIVILMTLLNIVVEFSEFIYMCFKFSALQYLTDPFNLIGMYQSLYWFPLSRPCLSVCVYV
jgi:hypothetical protein